MVNILIVDDEPMICKGISSLLARSGLEIKETFTAYNGFDALDYLRLETIDLIITDIQMSGMNGIELIEAVFVENPTLPVIVLSAHGEFEYARHALRFGVKDYLVKPISPPQFLEVVRHVLTSRDVKLRGLAETAGRSQAAAEEAQAGKYFILNQLLTEEMREQEVKSILKAQGYAVEEDAGYALFHVRMDFQTAGSSGSSNLSFRDKQLFLYAALNIVEETLEKWEKILFCGTGGAIEIILRLDPSRDRFTLTGANQLLMLAQLIHANISRYLHVKHEIGISTIHRGFGQLPAMYREACHVLSWSRFHKDHSIFFAEDFQSGAPEESPSAGSASMMSVPEQEQLAEDNNRSIQQALAFIATAYSQKGLKLQDVADSVHLSPNYLSYLFKKMVGLSLWDYVTKLRMEEGKRLLLRTDLRRYEIAEAVGYESPEHFSKIFKKHYGISPSELKG